MNPRQRMRASNRKSVMWLLKNGYDEIWLKSHTRRTDLVYTVGEWYRALDLWNLFDGIWIREMEEQTYTESALIDVFVNISGTGMEIHKHNLKQWVQPEQIKQ